MNLLDPKNEFNLLFCISFGYILNLYALCIFTYNHHPLNAVFILYQTNVLYSSKYIYFYSFFKIF